MYNTLDSIKSRKLRQTERAMHFKKKEDGVYIFLCRNEYYFPAFNFPTRSIWVVVTLSSFIYVAFLVNIYFCNSCLKHAYSRGKKITMKQFFLCFNKRKRWHDPKGSLFNTSGHYDNCRWRNLLKCNDGHQERDEEGGQMPTPLFPGNSDMRSLPTMIPEGLVNQVTLG